MTGILNDPILANRAFSALGIDAYPSSTGQVLGATAEESWIRNPTPSIARSITSALPAPSDEQIRLMAHQSGRPEAEIRAQIFSQLLTPEQANEKYGIAGELSFDRPVGEVTAARLRDMKREELQRRNVYQRARGGIGETLAQLGVGLAVSALDPINVASAFVPVVGPSRYAIWSARYGTPAARAMKGGLEGAAGAVAVEPIVYLQARAEQADYDAMDSLLNVAFGTALGGGLHLGVGWLGDKLAGRALSPLEAAVDGAGAGVRERAMSGAVAAVAEGRPVRVAEQLPELDPDLRGSQGAEPVAGAVEVDRDIPGFEDRSLRAAPTARNFELGAIEGAGSAARYRNYTPVSPGDRPWLEGVAREVAEAQEGQRTPKADDATFYGQHGIADWSNEIVATSSTFPRWFTEMNKGGDKVTREIVARSMEKLAKGEPLGAHEGRVAEAMMLEARARREENARQMVARRAAREQERMAEIERLAADDAPWFTPEDRAAAAEIEQTVAPTLRSDEATARDSDAAELEREIAELDEQMAIALSAAGAASTFRRDVDPGDVAGSIVDFVAEHERTPGNQLFLVIGEASPETVARVKADAGIDIEGYTHIIAQDGLRHSLGAHGEQSRRARLGGDLPVTADDVARVPEILAAPDHVEHGDRPSGRNLETVVYEKRFPDGTLVYLEEVRVGRKALALHTMYKKRPHQGGGPAGPAEPAGGEPPAKTVRQTSETTAGTAQTEDRPPAGDVQGARTSGSTRELPQKPGLNLGEEDAAALAEADALIRQAEELGEAYDAAAACISTVIP